MEKNVSKTIYISEFEAVIPRQELEDSTAISRKLGHFIYSYVALLAAEMTRRFSNIKTEC